VHAKAGLTDYRQQFVRSLRHFESFAVAFSVLLYIFTSRRQGVGEGEGTRHSPFGKYELPIMAGAVIWLAYELIILIGPKEFRDAQYYVLGALGLGLVFYIVQLLTEREAMRKEPGQE
jgi:hypothetical protein